jgi:hypothetical protein
LGAYFDHYLASFSGLGRRAHDRENAQLIADLLDLLVEILRQPVTEPAQPVSDLPPETLRLADTLIGALNASATTPEHRADALIAAQTYASVLRAQFPD